VGAQAVHCLNWSFFTGVGKRVWGVGVCGPHNHATKAHPSVLEVAVCVCVGAVARWQLGMVEGCMGCGCGGAAVACVCEGRSRE